MHRLFLPALLGLAAISGCSAFGPSTAGVLFETTATAYAPGDELTARLVNTTDGGIGYNLCFTTVEAKGAAWGPVGASDGDVACLSILLGLEAGEEARHVISLPDNLPAGRYRLATDVELGDGKRVTVTAPFEVR